MMLMLLMVITFHNDGGGGDDDDDGMCGQLQILFDDSLTQTFEYPSEQSLMAATPAQPGDVDYEGEDLIHSTGLLVTPSIVAAGENFHFDFQILLLLLVLN